MIQTSKLADERREGGALECTCLHGSVGMAADWRGIAKDLAATGIGSRAVDLWRFLEGGPLPMAGFAQALNAEAHGEVTRGRGRALLGYSMGGRLALHALLEKNPPWQAAVIIGAHPGLKTESERKLRRASDAEWATLALAGNWQAFVERWNTQAILGETAQRDPQAMNRLVMRRREVARSFVDWSLGAQESLWNRLPEISIPVLWVVGENDLKFLTIAQEACCRIPRGTLAIAPRSGHRVPWEAGAWFTERVARFLQLGHL